MFGQMSGPTLAWTREIVLGIALGVELRIVAGIGIVIQEQIELGIDLGIKLAIHSELAPHAFRRSPTPAAGGSGATVAPW